MMRFTILGPPDKVPVKDIKPGQGFTDGPDRTFVRLEISGHIQTKLAGYEMDSPAHVFAMDKHGCLVSFGVNVQVVPRQFEIQTL